VPALETERESKTGHRFSRGSQIYKSKENAVIVALFSRLCVGNRAPDNYTVYSISASKTINRI